MGATLRVIMANRSLRRQALMAAAVWTFCASMAVVVFAQGEHAELSGATGWLDRWATPQNIVSAAVLVYGLGVLREQFAQVRRELDSVKSELKSYREDNAPATYARQDMTDARFRELRDRVEMVEQRGSAH